MTTAKDREVGNRAMPWPTLLVDVDEQTRSSMTGSISANAQRLRYTAGNLRAQADRVEVAYHELIIRVANLRRDAEQLDQLADDLDTVWKGL